MIRLPILAFDSVADSSKVWRSVLQRSVIKVTSSRKPISSMRSASSSTKYSRSLKSRVLRSKCSFRRPGVPTRISGFLRRRADWLLQFSPPQTVCTFICVKAASPSHILATCSASSRVGVRIRPRVPALGLLWSIQRCNRGTKKASVLPLPVSAATRRSLPSSAGGKVAACTSVGVVIESWSKALSRRSLRGYSLNTKMSDMSFNPRIVAERQAVATSARGYPFHKIPVGGFLAKPRRRAFSLII